jgi:DNA-binding winged helix-turn-helix (wHTH) protein/Flp pilus assembly protein TadD
MEIHFDGYRLLLRERQLLGPEGPLDIDGRSLEVLRALLDKANRLVLKDEIFTAVWPGSGVGENTLQVHISNLRRALGPGVIATVHGRGYKYNGGAPQMVPGDTQKLRACGERTAVAVRSFRSLDTDPLLQRFCESLAGEVIERLSKFSLLCVVTWPFLAEARRRGEAGSNSSPDFLLTANVRRAGPETRVSARLHEAGTGAVVWADHFDRAAEDIVAHCDELSGLMAGRIFAKLEMRLGTQRVTGRALNSHEHLLKGIWHFRTQMVDAHRVAEEHFRKALTLDPANAEAMRWLSLRMTVKWLQERRVDDLKDGMVLARRAAELDPASATCHSALGLAQLWGEGLDIAAASLRRAQAINPNDGHMLTDVALWLIYEGHLAEARDLLDRTQQLMPFPSDWLDHYQAIGHFAEGQYAQALPPFQRLAPGAFTLVYLAACHAHLGHAAQAQRVVATAHERGLDLAQVGRQEPFRDGSVAERLSAGVEWALSLATPV